MKITKKYIVALVILVMTIGSVIFATTRLFAKTEKVYITQEVAPGYYWCQHANGTWSTYSEIDGTRTAKNAGGVPQKTRVKTFANVTMPTSNWKSKETGETINFNEIKNIKLTNVTLGRDIDPRMEAQVSIDNAKQQVVVNAYSGAGTQEWSGNFCGGQKSLIYPYPIVVTWEGEIAKDTVSYIMEPKEFVLNVGEKGQFKVYEVKNNDVSTKKIVPDWKIDWTTGDWQKVSVGTNGSVTGKLPTPEKVPIKALVKEANKTLTGTVYVKKDPNDVPPPTKPTDPDTKPEEPEKPTEPELDPPIVKIYGPDQVRAGEYFGLMASGYSPNGEIKEYYWSFTGTGEFEGNRGNQLYYLEVGFYDVEVVVQDEKDMFAMDIKTIEVLPPEPIADLKIDGHLKENRKVTIREASNSPDLFPIIEEQSYFTIKPTENTRLEDIKFIGMKDNYKKDNSYQIPFSDKKALDSLFKQKGAYEIDLYVVNTAGYSDRYSKRHGQALKLTIAEDQAPIAEFDVVTHLYREVEKNKRTAINVINKAYSKDDDFIDKVVYEVMYDKNNDGVFDEKPLVIDSSLLEKNKEHVLFVSDVMVWVTLDNNNNLEFLTNRVGKYDISQTVYEKFGQPTIEEFIIETDYLFSRAEARVVEVDNLAPNVGFEVGKMRNIDLQVAIGDTKYSKEQIESKLNEVLKPKLKEEKVSVNINVLPQQAKLNPPPSTAMGERIKKYNGSSWYDYIVMPTMPRGVVPLGIARSANDRDFFFLNPSNGFITHWFSQQSRMAHSNGGEDTPVPGYVGMGVDDSGKYYIINPQTGQLKVWNGWYYNHETSTMVEGKKQKWIDSTKLKAIPNDFVVRGIEGSGAQVRYSIMNVDTGEIRYWNGSDWTYHSKISPLPDNYIPFDVDHTGAMYIVEQKTEWEYVTSFIPDTEYRTNKFHVEPQKYEYRMYMDSFTGGSNGYIDLTYYQDPNYTNYHYLTRIYGPLYSELNNHEYNSIFVNFGGYTGNTQITYSGYNGGGSHRVYLERRIKDNSFKFSLSQSQNPLFALVIEDKAIHRKAPEKIASELNNKNAHLIAFGTTINKTQFDEVISTVGQGFYFDNTNLDLAVQDMAEYILEQLEHDMKVDLSFGIGGTVHNNQSVLQSKINSIVIPKLNEEGIKVSSLNISNINLNLKSTINLQFAAIIEDKTITQEGINTILKTTLQNNAYLSGLGKSTNKSQFNEIISKNMERGTFIDNTNIDTALNQYASYIIAEAKKHRDTHEIYLTLEDEAEYFTWYEDYEEDPLFKERWRYDHKPTIFENDLGLADFHLQNLFSSVKNFSKVGRYQTIYAARDNPTYWDLEGIETSFENYRKWSKEADNWYIYIHRKPVADFTFTINQTTGNYTIANKAYDLDKLSIDIGFGGGLRDMYYEWRVQGETEWKQGLPSGNLERKVYEVRQTVEDFQKEKANRIKLLDGTGINKPPIADFIPNPVDLLSGETVTLKNLSYDPNGDKLTYKWSISYDEGNTWTPFSTEEHPNKVVEGFGVVQFKLIATDPFGLSDEAIKSVQISKAYLKALVTHTDGWKEYWVGKGFEPDVNRFFAGEKFVIYLTSSPAQSVSGEIDFGTLGKIDIPAEQFTLVSKTTSEFVWYAELWREDFYTIPNGEYTFNFIANHPEKNPTHISKADYIIDIQSNIFEAYDFHRNY